jgi:IclR family acetate operon transcriptional repressor
VDDVSTSGPAGPPKVVATGGAKALVKGLALIDAVASSDAPVPLARLLDVTGLPRPTALRLLDALLEHRALTQDPPGTYALGPQVAVWGHSFLERLDVVRQAQSLMDGLAEVTRETCFLGVRDQRQVLYVAKADSPQAVRPAAGVGSRNPLHSTGIGKALLAFGAEADAASYADAGLRAKTPNTITDPDRLAEELALTRERGYAIDDVENEDGVRCVAAPVRDHTGEVVAAMSVAAPAYRFALEDLPALAPHVRAAADEVSARLGWGRPASDDGLELSA